MCPLKFMLRDVVLVPDTNLRPQMSCGMIDMQTTESENAAHASTWYRRVVQCTPIYFCRQYTPGVTSYRVCCMHSSLSGHALRYPPVQLCPRASVWLGCRSSPKHTSHTIWTPIPREGWRLGRSDFMLFGIISVDATGDGCVPRYPGSVVLENMTPRNIGRWVMYYTTPILV